MECKSVILLTLIWCSDSRLRNFFAAVAPKKASVAELEKFFRIAETQGRFWKEFQRLSAYDGYF